MDNKKDEIKNIEKLCDETWKLLSEQEKLRVLEVSGYDLGYEYYNEIKRREKVKKAIVNNN